MISSIGGVPYSERVRIAYECFVKKRTIKDVAEERHLHREAVSEIRNEFRGNFRDAIMYDWEMKNAKMQIVVDAKIVGNWSYNDIQKHYGKSYDAVKAAIQLYITTGFCVAKPQFTEEELAAEKFYTRTDDDVKIDFDEGTYLRKVQKNVKSGKIPIYALQNEITGSHVAKLEEDGKLVMRRFASAQEAIEYRGKNRLKEDVFTPVLYGWEVKQNNE